MCPTLASFDETSDYSSDSANSSIDQSKFVLSSNGIFLGYHEEGMLSKSFVKYQILCSINSVTLLLCNLFILILCELLSTLVSTQSLEIRNSRNIFSETAEGTAIWGPHMLFFKDLLKPLPFSILRSQVLSPSSDEDPIVITLEFNHNFFFIGLYGKILIMQNVNQALY